MCKSEFLHYLRVREWQDLHSQLRQACRQQGIDPDQATATDDATPNADLIHQSLLAGLLSHIGLRDEVKRDYLGARGARFAISPGSTLFRRQPTWVMSAELVETSRLWARTNARIDPVWAERLAPHLVKRTYSEPRWSRKQGAALATERVTLYGVPLVAARTVQYGRINPEESRDLFIRHALVEGDWETHHEFFRTNQALLQRLSELEERAPPGPHRRRRRPGRVLRPARSRRRRVGAPLRQLVEAGPAGDAQLLTFTEDLLTRESAEAVSTRDYPAGVGQGGLELPVTYQFEPGAAADGVTVHIPVQVLNQVEDDGFDWQVPGLRAELATALLKSLPKSTRRHFVPTPDHAAAALADAQPGGDRRLTDESRRVLHARTGVRVPAGEWTSPESPTTCGSPSASTTTAGGPLATGKDLDSLKDPDGRPGAAPDVASGSGDRAKGPVAVGLRRTAGDVRDRVGRPGGAGLPGSGRPRRSVDLVVLPGEREAGPRRASASGGSSC